MQGLAELTGRNAWEMHFIYELDLAGNCLLCCWLESTALSFASVVVTLLALAVATYFQSKCVLNLSIKLVTTIQLWREAKTNATTMFHCPRRNKSSSVMKVYITFCEIYYFAFLISLIPVLTEKCSRLFIPIIILGCPAQSNQRLV